MASRKAIFIAAPTGAEPESAYQPQEHIHQQEYHHNRLRIHLVHIAFHHFKLILLLRIRNEMLEPVLRYGILKERMSALITDAVRADLLESKGYDTQILEFIDMEHTPKNLLIRAVRTGKRSDQGKVEKMLAALNIHPTLDRLLNEKEQEGSVR